MKSKKSDQEYEVVIEPSKGWFSMDWKGLFHYRDLLFILVRRDFLAKYKQTILGPLWFVLQPLLTTLVFTVIFGQVTKIATDGIPPILFYLCGLAAWGYFSQSLSGIATSLTANSYLFSKVYFPRLIIPLSIVVSNLFSFLIQLATFLGFYIYFKFFTPAGASIHPTGWILLLPALLLESAAIALGVGLWIAALSVRYRDFQQLMGFITQLWMYATPIIYPLSALSPKWKIIAVLNPMTEIIESYRYAFFNTGVINLFYLGLGGLFILLTLLSGILVFNRVQRTFVDIL